MELLPRLCSLLPRHTHPPIAKFAHRSGWKPFSDRRTRSARAGGCGSSPRAFQSGTARLPRERRQSPNPEASALRQAHPAIWNPPATRLSVTSRGSGPAKRRGRLIVARRLAAVTYGAGSVPLHRGANVYAVIRIARMGGFGESTLVSCVLCEAALSADTVPVEVTATTPGAVCGACRALSPEQRDQLRTDAMTRMLRTSN